MKYSIGATADIGVEREYQEDFVQFRELDDKNLFCVIADGTCSRPQVPQPAAIISMTIIDQITSLFEEQREILFSCAEYFIKRSMLDANRLLGAFKMGNEEVYSGFAASVTCCLITEDDRFIVGHSGNTRLYVLRNGNLIQLTKDHTKAAELLNEGKIDIETYHVHPDRLNVTGGIGVVNAPVIQTFSGMLKPNDLILMTTDGIHYAIQPDAITEIVLASSDGVTATAALIDAAKNIVKYPDNMSAILAYRNPE